VFSETVFLISNRYYFIKYSRELNEIILKFALFLTGLVIIFLSCPAATKSDDSTTTTTISSIVGSWKEQGTNGQIYTFNQDGSFKIQIWYVSNYYIYWIGNYTYDKSTKTLTFIYLKIDKTHGGGLIDVTTGDWGKSTSDSIAISGNKMIFGVKGGSTSNLQGTWTGNYNWYAYGQSTPTPGGSSYGQIYSAIINNTNINYYINGNQILDRPYSSLSISEGNIVMSGLISSEITNSGFINGTNYFLIIDGVLTNFSTSSTVIPGVYDKQ
jgi:hypothetical protein